METLIALLRNSSVADLLVIVLVILSTVVLILAGIWITVASRSRTPIYFLLMIALLPLLLGLAGTYLRYREIERAAGMNPDVSNEVVAASRHEAWIVTYIGAAGTALPFLIGATGLVLKKDRKA